MSVSTISTPKAMNAIKSFFAADAAAMPLHWIYDYKQDAALACLLLYAVVSIL